MEVGVQLLGPPVHLCGGVEEGGKVEVKGTNMPNMYVDLASSTHLHTQLILF